MSHRPFSHAISPLEVLLRIRNELPIGGMIYGFNPDHVRGKRMIVLFQIFNKLMLRRGGPKDEEFFGSVKRRNEVVVESFGIFRVFFEAFLASRMLVMVIVRRSQNRPLCGWSSPVRQ